MRVDLLPINRRISGIPARFFKAASGRAPIFGFTLAIGLAPSLVCAGAAAESIIRDTEIEADIRTMVTPIWRAAGLEPSSLHVYLVEDKQINSFVAGGQNEFIKTGLLMRAKTPNQLIGVLAHETGHIAGGHLTRAQQAMRNASIEGIIAMGVAAGGAAVGRGGGVDAVLADPGGLRRPGGAHLPRPHWPVGPRPAAVLPDPGRRGAAVR